MTKLTAKKVENALPRKKEYKLHDGGGLFLRIRPSGAKSWLFSYRLPNDPKLIRMTLGSVKNISLKEARAKLPELHNQVSQGIDPRHARTTKQAENTSTITMQKLFNEWIEFIKLAGETTPTRIKRHEDRWRLHLRPPDTHWEPDIKMKPTLCPLEKNDFDEIVLAFKNIGWDKPKDIYEAYFKEQSDGIRSIILAKVNEKFCGYVTIKWKSDYDSFAQQNIPEISDLNVLPNYRNHGIGTALIHACEMMAKERGYTDIGLGVGMTADYGDAQHLYVQLGYMPDKKGLHYKCNSLKHGNQVTVDDDLALFFTKPTSSTNYYQIDLPTHIETPRLLLRPPQTNEGKILNAAVLESFELLNKYMPWAKEKPSLEESEAVVKREARNWLLKRRSDPELMLFILDKNTNDLIGATGFHGIDWDVPCAETGYWVRKKYLGQGYITEAINAITQYAFNVLKVKRLAITCDADNERSKRVPERLGYTLESIMKSNRIKPMTGEVTDTLVFVRTSLINLPELKVNWKRE